MACPHGKNSTPDSCSQCLGASPTNVAIVEGHVYVNGVDKGLLSQMNKERQNEETEGNMPQARKTCGRCRQPGHNVSTCNNAPVLPTE